MIKTDDPILISLLLDYVGEPGKKKLNDAYMYVKDDWELTLDSIVVSIRQFQVRAVFKAPEEPDSYGYRPSWWFHAYIDRQTGYITEIRV